MRYSLTKTTQPASEPLSLATAKAHCRVDTNDEDAMIEAYIVAARNMAEAYTSRQLITATYTMKLDEFPSLNADICLPRTPVGSVTSVAYIDANGDSQTLSTSVYQVLSNNTWASIVLKPGQLWPSTRYDQREAVTIVFTAGYGTSESDIPAAARAAMLLMVGHLYENREQELSGTITTELKVGVPALLDTISARVPV